MVRSSYKSIKALPDRSDFAASPVGTMVYHSAVGMWCAVGKLPVPTIEPGDTLCPELAQLVRPKPTYSVVTSAPTIEPSAIDDELPELYEAIARFTVAQNFATDPIEAAILEFLSSRSEGATIGRIRADKYALKSLTSEEIETYLSVLTEEGKVTRDGATYRLV
ncbi:MAG: hypothetical protein HC805_08900 [Alkalinema sp. RL_2_19]|nr:hypothetical protein [Alkalinema sp. RL_2_19]